MTADATGAGARLEFYLLWFIAVADLGIAAGYASDRRWALAVVYVAFSVSQAAMAWA